MFCKFCKLNHKRENKNLQNLLPLFINEQFVPPMTRKKKFVPCVHEEMGLHAISNEVFHAGKCAND